MVAAVVALVAVALVAGPSSTTAKDSNRLIFPHKLHVQEVGAECATCHQGVESSTDNKTRFIPGMDVCASCHDVEAESGCVMCHSDPNNVVTTPRPGKGYEAFSHKLHTGKMECKTCHTVQSGLADVGAPFPMMKNCTECHTEKSVAPTCNQCHSAGIPSEPTTHKVDWKAGHALDARFDTEDCAMCHTAPGASSTCEKCHVGSTFGTPHPRNFVHSTAFTRGGGLADCQACHEPESFCAACHQQKRVLPSDHSRTGWATPKPTSGGMHAKKGEMDLESCVICHASMAQQPTCFSAGCHQ